MKAEETLIARPADVVSNYRGGIEEKSQQAAASFGIGNRIKSYSNQKPAVICSRASTCGNVHF